MRWQAVLASFAVVVVLVAPCSANMLTNGSFETFGTLSEDYLGYSGCAKLDVNQTVSWAGEIPTYSSTTALPGWTASRIGESGFAWIMNNVPTGAGYGNIENGSYALNFGDRSDTAESISQSFAVTAGTSYAVSYYEKYRTSSGGTLQCIISATDGTLTVGASTISTPTGTGTATLTQTTLGTSSSYDNYTFTFTVSQDTQATLTFRSGTFSDNGIFLDNVSVTATPEPSTLVLVASGLFGLLCYAWRKRR